MMQDLALLLDSWRLLCSRKLFWVTLAINLLVILLYGSIGFTPKGVTLLFGVFEIDARQFRLGLPLARELYLTIFSNLIVTLWLGWIATALAVISTASIIPDFLSEGGIDLVLAKPITRIRVFLVKYCGSLLFVLLQVATFCVGAFFCIGLRLNEWNFGMFMAIPLIVLFFSYIYCVCVLVGVVTRSTLAALIVTALFWFMLFVFFNATVVIRQITYSLEAEAEMSQERVDDLEKRVADLIANGMTSDNSNQYERARGSLETARLELKETSDNAIAANHWLVGARIASAAVPKHRGTLDLVDRWVGKDPRGSVTDLLTGANPEFARDETGMRVSKRMESEDKGESALWIIGSSLAFEMVVLALAAWLFVRKDF